MENVLSQELAYFDFAGHFLRQDLNILEKAKIFEGVWDGFVEHDALFLKRVALNGSGPIRVIWDNYVQKEREMIYLASNDYLNLTNHPKVVAAGQAALAKYGAGAGSVPLFGGTLDIHVELEQKIAKFKGCESALIYTSGFGSNASTLLSLLQAPDLAILDRLVHASVVDGCAATNVWNFKHNDVADLEKLLVQAQGKYRNIIVAIDGVYSMDGDIAPLDKIHALTEHYGAMLMIDEAHSSGVIGKNGRGTPEYFQLEGKIDIVAGTFSKGLGGVGGFIAGKKELIKYLSFYSRGYMFSTAMAPQTCASLIAALDVVENEPEIRARLWRNIHYFRSKLTELGFKIGNSETAIFPIIIGDNLLVNTLCQELHNHNIYVNPVLHPVVPRKLSRLRLSIMSEHTIAQLDRVLEVLSYLGKKYQLI
jgi:glycine C-acetyltransferase